MKKEKGECEEIMATKRKAIMDNYGQENIDAIRESLKHSGKGESKSRKVFTMVHTNSGTKVNITPESRMACGKAMLR